jgi:hypothetical protein
MSDIVERLRAEVDPDVNEPLDRLLDEAADEIENLRLELEEIAKMGERAYADGSPAAKMGDKARAAVIRSKP